MTPARFYQGLRQFVGIQTTYPTQSTHRMSTPLKILYKVVYNFHFGLNVPLCLRLKSQTVKIRFNKPAVLLSETSDRRLGISELVSMATGESINQNSCFGFYKHWTSATRSFSFCSYRMNVTEYILLFKVLPSVIYIFNHPGKLRNVFGQTYLDFNLLFY